MVWSDDAPAASDQTQGACYCGAGCFIAAAPTEGHPAAETGTSEASSAAYDPPTATASPPGCDSAKAGTGTDTARKNGDATCTQAGSGSSGPASTAQAGRDAATARPATVIGSADGLIDGEVRGIVTADDSAESACSRRAEGDGFEWEGDRTV